MKEYIVNLTDISEYGRRMIIGNGIPKEELIRCKDCQEHGQRTNMCGIWHHHTNPEGYCHRAKAVKKNDTK